MAETNVTFAKIVATPTLYSWAQAYNAGKLFAVLSLEKNEEELEEKDVLNLLGKEILDKLEQEYYTLETKDLDAIKNAVLVTSKKIPEEVFCSFVIGAVVNNILYAFVLGKGKVDIKRGDKFGTILHVEEAPSSSIKAASGFLQNDDVVVLETIQFSDIFPSEVISSTIDHQPPSEVAETLAPKLHSNEKGQSGAAAIVVSYKAPAMEEDITAVEPSLADSSFEDTAKKETVSEGQEKEENAQTNDDEYFPQAPIEVRSSSFVSKFKNYIPSVLEKIKIPKFEKLNHSKKLFLTIAVIIAVVLVASVVLATKKQNDAKTQNLFNQIYPQAQKKYDEGESLLSLNQSLAHDSFQASQTILEGGKTKFPKNSTQEQQILALLDKVNQALNASSGVNSSSATQVDTNSSAILSAEIKNPNASYFAEDDTNVYFSDSNGVSSMPKSGGSAKVIIKSSDLPKNIGGLSVYYGNIYVLDKDNKQIDKFVQTSGGFTKTSYFAGGVSPDLTNADAISIDGSIWILFSDGSIEKFTRGNPDNLSISGLDKPFSSPTRIFTTVDFSNIYVLDKGNSRIVVLDKNGNYKAQYQAGIIKNASDFEVLETDKKIYVLSGGKVYQIDLK
jgi:hypothetical protein